MQYARRSGTKLLVVTGLVVAVALAVAVSPFASSQPDGLDKVAIDHGFSDAEAEHAFADSPLAGYAVDGVDSEPLATGLAGLIGVGITFAVGAGVFALLRASRRRQAGARPLA